MRLLGCYDAISVNVGTLLSPDSTSRALTPRLPSTRLISCYSIRQMQLRVFPRESFSCLFWPLTFELLDCLVSSVHHRRLVDLARFVDGGVWVDTLALASLKGRGGLTKGEWAVVYVR
jgi:hypothetical protein